VLAPLIKRLIETGLNGEIERHLSEKKPSNRRIFVAIVLILLGFLI
jgi:hypothetical protein